MRRETPEVGAVHHVEGNGRKVASCGLSPPTLSTTSIKLVTCRSCREAIREALLRGPAPDDVIRIETVGGGS